MNKVKFHICVGTYLLLAMLLLLLPLPWIIAACIAAAVHECFHIGAVWLCAGSVGRIRVGEAGARIDTQLHSRVKAIFCLLAGPAGGLLLLLFARWIPRIAVCGAVHSLYNLLPIEPLDGGQALRCVTELLIPQKADKVCRVVQRCFLVGIFLVGIYGCICLKLGLFPLILALGLILKAKSVKTPCKPVFFGLQ